MRDRGVRAGNRREQQVLSSLPFVVLEHCRHRQPDSMHPAEALCFIEERSASWRGPERALLEKQRRAAWTFEQRDTRSGFAGCYFGPGMFPEIGGEWRWKEQGGCGRGLHVAAPR